MKNPALLSRIALFSALIYVLSWGTSYIPNLNLVFFIVFTSGFLWGIPAGAVVGLVGMGLWTVFNPYGPAALPIMIAQMVGASLSSVVGGLFAMTNWQNAGRLRLVLTLILSSIACTVFFYIPVNLADAWIFQPFWPRFIAGISWMFISLVSNAIIFPLLFNMTRYLYLRESRS